MSSPNHLTSGIKDVFSSNFPDFISASLDYVPASPGKTYSSSSNSFVVVLIASPTLSLFHDDPYMKTLAALADPESDKWLEAMNTEMQSMKDNQVWILVELPPNGRIVGSKWLFKKKTDMDGNVYTFKARLVAKVYTQTYGVDYGETFSPVANIRAIRILLAIAAFYDYEIWQMDVKTAFLNGHLSEDVYMVQPKGFVDPKHSNKVCKLQRFIYGLKQTSRSWNKRFNEKIKKIGFTQNPDEPCVYLTASGSNVAFLVLYGQ
ncbi:retrotransposon protein, putative, ty1-copia subclass [Tanacetum coccineum]